MATSDPANGAGAGGSSNVDQILQTETGGRATSGYAAVILFIVPLVWSLFQLWIASPLPYIFNFAIFNSTEARSIHLAFAVFLAFWAVQGFVRKPPQCKFTAAHAGTLPSWRSRK